MMEEQRSPHSFPADFNRSDSPHDSSPHPHSPGGCSGFSLPTTALFLGSEEATRPAPPLPHSWDSIVLQ